MRLLGCLCRLVRKIKEFGMAKSWNDREDMNNRKRFGLMPILSLWDESPQWQLISNKLQFFGGTDSNKWEEFDLC
ncbi:hypothetical protein [Thermodesulfovibrio sp.]|uniref:hypothetical protein n=1 Tax=Thermodesulfovibrio sp. TaxID=2067987 RepID=UPI0030B6E3E1